MIETNKRYEQLLFYELSLQQQQYSVKERTDDGHTKALIMAYVQISAIVNLSHLKQNFSENYLHGTDRTFQCLSTQNISPIIFTLEVHSINDYHNLNYNYIVIWAFDSICLNFQLITF